MQKSRKTNHNYPLPITLRRDFNILLSFLLPIVVSAQFNDLGSKRRPTSCVASPVATRRPSCPESRAATKSSYSSRDCCNPVVFGVATRRRIQLTALFNKFKPSAFDVFKARKVAAERQYLITGKWTIQINGKPQAHTLRITLCQKNTGWSLQSIHG
jgi:hypothetical protein